MTKIIGLTGGIGSGKTTIANYFQSMGIPIYIADNQARKIMQSDEIISEIKKIFGETVFENEVLNREKLAGIVFKNPEKLEQLNKIIHPAVKKHFNKWVQNHKNEPFVIYEAAILFESGSYKKCDKIITVISPLETRIQRVMQRDNATRDQVLQRISRQWDDNQRISKSDFVIENDNIEKTKQKVDDILKILRIQQHDS